MQPQLEAVVGNLESARQRLASLSSILSLHEWQARPAPGCWSAAGCVMHLNLSSEALLPLLRSGLQEAHACGRRAGAEYRRDAVGWLISKIIAPSGGLKTRTVPAFVPTEFQAADALVSRFERLQAEVVACVRAADGLPIDRVKIVSPFDSRVKYNLYSALTLVPRHQHRHLLQAERAARAIAPLASPLAV